MNQEQTNSIVRSVLKIAGAIALALGATKASSIINSEDCIGLVVLLVGLWESHQSHADTLLKAIKEFSQGPAPAMGGGTKVTEGTKEPVAAAELKELVNQFAAGAAEVPQETMLANAAAQLKSPISINQGGGSPASETRSPEPIAAPAQLSAGAGDNPSPTLAAPNVTLVTFDAPPQPLQPTTIANPPTT